MSIERKNTKLINELVAEYQELYSRSNKLELKINVTTHKIIVDKAIVKEFEQELKDLKEELIETDDKLENVKEQLIQLGYHNIDF